MSELTRLAREILYRGKVFDLIVDRVRYPSGRTGVREIAHHPGGAVVVPILPDGRVIMVRQLRYPFDRHLMELPAGKLSPGEEPSAAAARELTEETGWIAGRLEPITSLYTTPGFCDEELHLFLATDLRESPDGHRREEGEFSMTVHLVPLNAAVDQVLSGDIRDAKTIAGLLLAERRLKGIG